MVNMSMVWIVEKRVWVDDTTYERLSGLFKITRGFIPRDILCDAIIYEWIKSGGDKKVGNIILNEYTPKVHCVWIVIQNNLWNDFKTLCSIRELDINVGFRIAIYRFIYLINDGSIDLLKYFFK